MATSVVVLAPTEAIAQRTIDRLRLAGMRGRKLTAPLPDPGPRGDHDLGERAIVPVAALAGVLMGGMLGGGLAWFMGTGMVPFPVIGYVAAADPIQAAHSGAALAAIAGGIAGALVGLGSSGLRSARTDGASRGGRILIAVEAVDATAMARIADIVADEGEGGPGGKHGGQPVDDAHEGAAA